MPVNTAGGGMETLTEDSADERYVNESGDRIDGIMDMNNNQIKNLGDPIDSGDAVNIKYFTSALAPALALALAPALTLALAPYNTLITELRTKQIKNEAVIVKHISDYERQFNTVKDTVTILGRDMVDIFNKVHDLTKRIQDLEPKDSGLGNTHKNKKGKINIIGQQMSKGPFKS